jgi:hypothetical protein
MHATHTVDDRHLPLKLCAKKIGEQRMTSLPALLDVDQR